MENYHDQKVRPRNLKKGDLFLRRIDGGKLDPNWKGPYVLGNEVNKGAFQLFEQDGVALKNTVIESTWSPQTVSITKRLMKIPGASESVVPGI